MTKMKQGDKVNLIGDPDHQGTIIEITECDDNNTDGRCKEQMAIFETDLGTRHRTHLTDLEPA